MPRKRKHSETQETNAGSTHTDDVSKSVLGGMKGGHRLDGSEDHEHGGDTYKVPFGEKSIICQSYGTEASGKDRPATFIFTHGAGGGIANPATAEFAQGYALVSPLVCFQGTMNLQNRIKCFKAVLASQPQVRALGGRSMGARAAVITATQNSDKVDAVVLVSFPLTSARGGDSREDILLELPASIDVLFVIGDGDSMCNLHGLSKVRKKMKARSWLVVVQGADHSMSLKRKSAVNAMRQKTGQIAAHWLESRPSNGTAMTILWDDEQSSLSQSEWQREADASSR